MLRYLKNVSTLKVEESKCTGCAMCIHVCPRQVLEIKSGKVAIDDLDACIECGACMSNCAFDAISVKSGVGCAQAIINGILKGTEPD